MKTITIVVLAFFITVPALCQNYLKTPAEVDTHANTVVNHMAALKHAEAFATLKAYWPLAEKELTELEKKTVEQFGIVEERFGKVVGHEHVRDERIKDVLLRKVYVLKCERHLIRVVFTYYNNGKGYLLNSFKWDDSIDELLGGVRAAE